MTRRRGAARPAQRRAFALPMVVIIALIAGLAVAVLLERGGISHAATQRDVRSYQDHHRNASMQLAIQRWLSSSHDQIRERLAFDEPEFVMIFDGGRQMRVEIADGQGAVLRNFDSLGGNDRIVARRIVSQLEALLPPTASPAQLDSVFRSEGPLAVSAHAAPAEVLFAVAAAVCVNGNPQLFADRLCSFRDDHDLDEADVRNACEEAGMSQDESAVVMSLVTTAPTLWRAVAEVDNGGGLTGLAYRAGGVFQTAYRRTSGGGGATTAVFLGWKDLPLDADSEALFDTPGR